MLSKTRNFWRRRGCFSKGIIVLAIPCMSLVTLFLCAVMQAVVSPDESGTMAAVATAAPTRTVGAVNMPALTNTPRSTDTPNPTDIPEPTSPVDLTEPDPTDTPGATNTPEPTNTPNPTDTPEPTSTVGPTDTHAPTRVVTQTPAPTPTLTLEQAIEAILDQTKPGSVETFAHEYFPATETVAAEIWVEYSVTFIVSTKWTLIDCARASLKTAEALYALDPTLDRLTMITKTTFVDSYGKESELSMITIQFTRTIAEKVVWKNLQYCNLPIIAESFRIHPAVQADWVKACK